jgi:hypothetical protein
MRAVLSMLVVASNVLVSTSTAVAQSTTPGRPCDRPEYRQFDFWIGDWEVSLPNGNAAGSNRIQSITAGCALREEWTGTGGFTGTSLNGFDAGSGRWHQTWIGSDGMVLMLDGGLRDGAMELSGVTSRNGAKTLHRIRWTPLPGTPPTVRQLWESSTDGGKTWTVAFDGLYRKKQ